MEDKEHVYDDLISPLVSQIIEICKQNQIPHFMSFQYNNTDFCSSFNPHGGHGVFSHYDILRRCAEQDGINVDKYIFWLLKHPNTSSICLSQLGNKCTDHENL